MKCKYCEDKGIAHYANGYDDYDEDYCMCEAGEKLREEAIDRLVDRVTDDQSYEIPVYD